MPTNPTGIDAIAQWPYNTFDRRPVDPWMQSERDFQPKSYPDERRGKGAQMKGAGKGIWDRDRMFSQGPVGGISLERATNLKSPPVRDEPAYSVYDKTPELDLGTVAQITGHWLNLYSDTPPDATPDMHELARAWGSAMWNMSPPSTPSPNLRTPPTTPGNIRSSYPPVERKEWARPAPELKAPELKPAELKPPKLSQPLLDKNGEAATTVVIRKLPIDASVCDCLDQWGFRNNYNFVYAVAVNAPGDGKDGKLLSAFVNFCTPGAAKEFVTLSQNARNFVGNIEVDVARVQGIEKNLRFLAKIAKDSEADDSLATPQGRLWKRIGRCMLEMKLSSASLNLSDVPDSDTRWLI